MSELLREMKTKTTITYQTWRKWENELNENWWESEKMNSTKVDEKKWRKSEIKSEFCWDQMNSNEIMNIKENWMHDKCERDNKFKMRINAIVASWIITNKKRMHSHDRWILKLTSETQKREHEYETRWKMKCDEMNEWKWKMKLIINNIQIANWIFNQTIWNDDIKCEWQDSCTIDVEWFDCLRWFCLLIFCHASKLHIFLFRSSININDKSIFVVLRSRIFRS